MVVDPFKDPAVQKKMMELQQRKYRQGHRNATDRNGNPAYTLTEDDRISCLDPQMQAVVRDEKQKVQKLADYAKPFEFSLGIGEMPPSYIVNITHPSWGHARRSGLASQIDKMSNPETWFKQQIDSMKKELGYRAQVEKLEEKIRQKNEKGYSVTDKRSRKKAEPLHCPDHGNELVRGEDANTLVCTVVGCTKKARRKTKPTVAIAVPIVKTPDVPDGEKTIAETFADLEKNFQNVVANINIAPATSAMQAIQQAIAAAGGGRFTPNSSMPVLEQQGDRFYLVQQVGPGREAYVDITDIIEARLSASGGNAVRYVNVPPVMLHPGQELVALMVKG